MEKKRLYDKNDKIAISESKNFNSKVLKFANSGCGMSERWWNETYRIKENGSLWGIYQTPSGKLRRVVV
jgi:hypothetical protein